MILVEKSEETKTNQPKLLRNLIESVNLSTSEQFDKDTVAMLRKLCKADPKGKGYVQGILTLTPQLAHQLLRINTKNRNVSGSMVAKYARDIAEGKWKMTGSTIQISKKNKMIDGQHRCFAVISSGIPIQVSIFIGVEDEAYSVIDRGVSKGVCHDLARSGVSNGKIAAAVAMWILKYSLADKNKMISCPPEYLSQTTVLETFNENREQILESMKYGQKMQNKGLMSAAPAAFVHWAWSQINPSKADERMERLIVGAWSGVEPGDPIFNVRERLQSNSKAQKKFAPQFLIAWCFKAWNYLERGKTIVNAPINWQRKGNAKEDFPVLTGWNK